MKSLLKSLRLSPWFGLALVVAALTGCTSAPTPSAYNIEIKTDSSLAGTSLQVDLVGANELADLPKWQSYSVTSYWQPGNAFRRDALKSTMEFGRGRVDTQTLSATDPKWSEWIRTGALYLVIVADLPGAVSDQAGNADPRRLIIPLDKEKWGGKVTTIQVLVQESGLRLLTPRKP
jgi:hypothetical protein